jgi:hypothetical protein
MCLGHTDTLTTNLPSGLPFTGEGCNAQCLQAPVNQAHNSQNPPALKPQLPPPTAGACQHTPADANAASKPPDTHPSPVKQTHMWAAPPSAAHQASWYSPCDSPAATELKGCQCWSTHSCGHNCSPRASRHTHLPCQTDPQVSCAPQAGIHLWQPSCYQS